MDSNLNQQTYQPTGTTPYQQTTQPYQQNTQPYQQNTQPYQQNAQSYQQATQPYQQTSPSYQQTSSYQAAQTTPQYQSFQQAPAYQQPQGYYTQQPAKEKSPIMGIISIICSGIGFLTGIFIIGLVLDVASIVLGIISISTKEPMKGLAISGIALSALSILLVIAYYAFAISLTGFY